MLDLKEFLGYAEYVYDFLVIAGTYWPITLLVAMYFTMSKTWEYYLAMMHLKEERDRLKAEGKDFSIEQKIFGYPMLVRGLLWDVFLNSFVGTFFFAEPPRYDKKEWLFTGRVSRWKDTYGKRGKIARWFCKHFLDPFEKGGHC